MGQLIQLSNNSFIQDHPFGDPFISPSGFENFVRYIFPGDEIVLWHKISLPVDVGAAAIGNIKFLSATASILAKKSQEFSEEFSVEFKSTRTFPLDSFTTTFNNGNATMQLWGADGYAPNIHLKQDRNWLLPSGDFRRQINFFTDHAAGSSNWDYYFYFPILFRWEYWISLLGVSDDFFSLSQPQNGQNHWWYHYFTSMWKLFSRLEINCLVLGEETKIRTELLLTPPAGLGGVRSYFSNIDYLNKEIKTAKIGDIPSNVPAFIYSNADTMIVASLKKDTAWDIGEKDNLSALVWIEPYEGAGIAARTRGSSIYQITPESVFKGLGLSATDDDGIGYQDEVGQYVVKNPGGTGAKLLIDAGDDSLITIFGLVDYKKLNITYPGVKVFTVYARLYNSSRGIDFYKKGEEIYQVLTLATPVIENTLCQRKESPCGFVLDVFADEADDDELKNDKSDFLAYGDSTIQNIVFILAKINDCGDYTAPADFDIGGSFDESFDESFDIGTIIQLAETANGGCAPGIHSPVAIIEDDLYGKYFAFGKSHDFSGNDFIDDYDKKYTGLLLEWQTVLALHGQGKYQLIIAKQDVFGNITATCDAREFCLKPYHCNLADGTVRIETVNEGLRGSLFEPTILIDYAKEWYGQMRLKGIFRYKSSGYVKEFNQYGESRYNAFRPITNEQQPKYSLKVKPVPGWMDFILSTNVLQADEIKITDYNINGRQSLIGISVMNDGDFTPDDTRMSNPNAMVEIAFAYGQNNLRKRNSG